ncbi:MAG: NADP oxidoreductase [Bacteroidota bacterium]
MLFLAYKQWGHGNAGGSFALSIQTMYTKQTIAIIGASSRKASVILNNIAGGNYRLLFVSGKNDQLQDLIEKIQAQNSSADIEIVDCSFNACWEADIIIAAVTAGEEKAFADKIKQVANRKIVINVARLLENDSFQNFDFKRLLPNTNVVTIYSAAFVSAFFGTATSHPVNEVLMAGDEEAIPVASELINTAGYTPVVANHFAVL